MKTIEKNTIESLLLTDTGLETTMIYHNNIELPHFAAFTLLDNPKYNETLDQYFRNHLEIAKKYNAGFILESVTWRANSDWGYKLGYNDKDLDMVNRKAIRQLNKIKNEYENEIFPIYISGCIGPRKDGYQIKSKMSVAEAKDYHNKQISSFKKEGVDFTTALTINYSNEGLGIVLAAMVHKLPVVISFTVESDGKLPSGETLRDVISHIDNETNNYPKYYMINCAHPTHFTNQLVQEDWIKRIRGIRANASCKSHAELDNSNELDSGDKKELATWYKKIKQKLPNLFVYGGCCGTDVSHIESICQKVAC